MCICYISAIDVAIRTGDHIAAFTKAYNLAKENITKQILELAKHKPTPSISYNNSIYTQVIADGHQQGYIGIAFQNAFYHLLNTNPIDGFSKVMKDTIYLGGDTDTNACIAGALYAACHGYENWCNTIMTFFSDKNRVKLYEPLDHQNVLLMLKKNLN